MTEEHPEIKAFYEERNAEAQEEFMEDVAGDARWIAGFAEMLRRCANSFICEKHPELLAQSYYCLSICADKLHRKILDRGME